MNKADRAALRELLESATPGPWEPMSVSFIGGDVGLQLIQSMATPHLRYAQLYSPIDAAFIAAARNSLASLLDYVDALETIAGAIDDTEMDEWCSDATLAGAIAVYRKAKR